ncbi:MAG TPA: radical SAM protein [Deltaproteobacteria bacterium]|nr:radical SAM protein [Deltaproteobacteria bacterium]
MQGGVAIAGLSPIVVPIFISNIGCPHRCLFCDQRQFSDPVDPEDVSRIVLDFIASCDRPDKRRRLIAFYGGSFTGINPDLSEKYIVVAQRLLKQGVVHGIKASTRPDMVSGRILSRLKDAGFVELELGAQSMDDKVLDASGRGHGAEHVIRASGLVKASGMKLGIQIMPGLPGEDRESFRRTVDEVVRLNPDCARIYPTVVMRGTGLFKLYEKGGYEPLDIDEAVSRSLYAYIRLTQAGCRILRMGLPPSKGLRIEAGPYHESFGFLVKAKAYRIMTQRLMEHAGSNVQVLVHPKDVSELLGYRRNNIEELCFSYSFDEDLPRGYVQMKGATERGCIQLKDIIEYIL